MPSPTSSTSPTSVRVISGVNCSISRWMTELISSALNFMRLSFDQSLAKLEEAALDRGIITDVADLDDQSPDQACVRGDIQDRRRAGQPGEPIAKRIQLVLIERNCR